MPDLFRFSPEMQLYFKTLPQSVQQSLLQSNLKLGSLEDLKAYTEHFCGQKPTQD